MINTTKFFGLNSHTVFTIIFSIILATLPIVNLPIGLLGGAGKVAGWYFVCILALLCALQRRQLWIPRPYILYFILWVFIWAIFSLINWNSPFLPGALYLGLLFLGGVSFLIFYGLGLLVRSYSLVKSVITFSLIFVCLYIIGDYYFGDQALLVILCKMLSNINQCMMESGRVSGFAPEPSHFSFYLFFALPFAMIQILGLKNKLLTFVLFLLISYACMLTQSRAVIIVFFVNVFLSIIFYWKKTKNLLFLLVGISFSAFLFYKVNSVPKNYAYNITEKHREISNNTRFYTIYAGILKGLDYFPFGSGIGTFQFEIEDYLNRFHSKSSEIRNYIELARRGEVIPAHSLPSKFFAEVGLGVMFLIFPFFYFLFLFFKAWDKLNHERRFLVFSLIFGLAFSFCLIDSLRYISFWLAAAVILSSLDRYQDTSV
jgi:hypothetical protein